MITYRGALRKQNELESFTQSDTEVAASHDYGQLTAIAPAIHGGSVTPDHTQPDGKR